MQSWRTTHFTDEHEDSIVTVTLEEVEDGTLLTLVHSKVPDGQTSYEQGGWQERYFEPMKQYFAARNRPNADWAATAAAPKAERKQRVGRKSKRTARATKIAAGKERAVAAKSKSKRAKKAKSESRSRRRG